MIQRWLPGLIMPAGIFLSVFFFFPLAQMFVASFADHGSAYADLVNSRVYLVVIYRTFELAAIVTVVSLVLAYPTAYFLATSRGIWRILGFIVVLLPFWTSVLVRTYAWSILLGRNGVINRTLIELGLIGQPITLLNTSFAVILGMVHVMLPFMILPIYNAMVRIDSNLPRAAQGLGAGAWAVFSRIYLPLTLQGIIAGVTLVFVISLGFFITPALLGGGRVIMIAMVIEQQVRETLNWELASAMSLVLLTVTLVVFGLLNRISSFWLRWKQ